MMMSCPLLSPAVDLQRENESVFLLTARTGYGLPPLGSVLAWSQSYQTSQPGYDKMRDIRWHSTPERVAGASRCSHPCLPGTRALGRR